MALLQNANLVIGKRLPAGQRSVDAFLDIGHVPFYSRVRWRDSLLDGGITTVIDFVPGLSDIKGNIGFADLLPRASAPGGAISPSGNRLSSVGEVPDPFSRASVAVTEEELSVLGQKLGPIDTAALISSEPLKVNLMLGVVGTQADPAQALAQTPSLVLPSPKTNLSGGVNGQDVVGIASANYRNGKTLIGKVNAGGLEPGLTFGMTWPIHFSSVRINTTGLSEYISATGIDDRALLLTRAAPRWWGVRRLSELLNAVAAAAGVAYIPLAARALSAVPAFPRWQFGESDWQFFRREALTAQGFSAEEGVYPYLVGGTFLTLLAPEVGKVVATYRMGASATVQAAEWASFPLGAALSGGLDAEVHGFDFRTGRAAVGRTGSLAFSGGLGLSEAVLPNRLPVLRRMFRPVASNSATEGALVFTSPSAAEAVVGKAIALGQQRLPRVQALVLHSSSADFAVEPGKAITIEIDDAGGAMRVSPNALVGDWSVYEVDRTLQAGKLTSKILCFRRRPPSEV